MSPILFVAALLHAYVGLRLLPDLPFGSAGVVAGTVVLVLSLSLIPHGFRSRRTRHPTTPDRLMWGGLLAMGAFSSLVVLTFLRDIGLLVALVTDALTSGNLPMTALASYSAVAVPAVAAMLTIVGYFNARRLAVVRAVDVPIADLPDALDGFAIAQITDMHIGPTIRRDHVVAVVDAVNRLGPDMIAITGDLVDGSVRQLSVHTQPLSRLSARHGVYFVTGNHEYYSGARSWVAELRRLGLHVLMNEHVVLEHAGAAIVVAGVTDYAAHHYEPTHRSDPAAAIAGAPASAKVKVLLAHQPRSALAAATAGFDLQLSGHTHGGQFVPWNFFVRFQQPFTAGLRRLGRLWVYTSRGTGYWGPPKRLGAPSEITYLRLVRA